MKMKIIDVCKQNKDQYETIMKLSEEIQNIHKKRYEKIVEIKDVYTIVFKRLNSKKTPTGILIKGVYANEKEKSQVYVNTRGISFDSGYDYESNSNYIDGYTGMTFIDLLKQLEEKKEQIELYVKDNKKIALQFFEKTDELDIKECHEIKLEKNWNVLKDEKSKENIIYKIELKPSNIRLKKIGEDNKESYYSDDLNIELYRQKLTDKILIEQIYPELKEVMEKCLEIDKQSLKKYQDFLDNVRTKFGKQLIADSFNNKK